MPDASGFTVSDAPTPIQAVPDAKRPLYRDLPPAPAFPQDSLGELRAAAEAIHDITRAPLAICGQSVLATATLAVQAHYDVELPGAGRRPLTAIFVSVAESGERKSSVDRLALRPVHLAEERFRGADGPARRDYANAREAWEAARAHAKKVAKGNSAAMRRSFDEIGPEPQAPPHPMLLVADPTPEALVMHLADGRPWGGVFTAEAGLLIGGAAFTDESRMRTGALLNVLWDGDPIRRRRVGTGVHYLPGRRCTAHLMMQPTVATKLMGDATLGGIGTLARVLLVAPESTAGTRLWRESPPSAEVALDAYRAVVAAVMAKRPRVALDNADELDPLPLTLHPEAAIMWRAFHDYVERAQRPEGELAAIRAFASKLPEHAGRIAAVLAAIADPELVEVSAEAMAQGIILAQHYAEEMLRLNGCAAVAPDLRLAQRLLTWWQVRTDRRCHLAAIYQHGPNPLRDAATARRIVTVLEEHGWVRRLEAGTLVDDAPRKDAWELVP